MRRVESEGRRGGGRTLVADGIFGEMLLGGAGSAECWRGTWLMWVCDAGLGWGEVDLEMSKGLDLRRIVEANSAVWFEYPPSEVDDTCINDEKAAKPTGISALLGHERAPLHAMPLHFTTLLTVNVQAWTTSLTDQLSR